jgi:hypothetical protein
MLTLLDPFELAPLPSPSAATVPMRAVAPTIDDVETHPDGERSSAVLAVSTASRLRVWCSED